MEQWVIQTLASALGGGFAGGVLTLLYNHFTNKQRAEQIEKGVIASLAAELRYSKSICELIGGQGAYGRLSVRFPTTVALNVALLQRYSFPRLAALQKDLEYYTFAVIYLNQKMELYEKQRSKFEVLEIADYCSGKSSLADIGAKTYFLPALVDHLLENVLRLSK